MSDSSGNRPIRVVFLGTPMFSVPTLKALIADPAIEVLGVMSQPDKPVGRGQKLAPPAVKACALEHNLPVCQPKRLRKDEAAKDWLRSFEPDFLITVAFGQILSDDVLAIPKYGTVNVHASLLPLYRGPNPIQWSVLHGQKETGLTTMLTDSGVDTGDMLLKEIIPIGENETAHELTLRLSQAGGPLLIKTLTGMVAGTVTLTPQDHEASTHAPKLEKEDAFIDWNQSAQELHCKIRGQQPWPGAVTFWQGKRIKLLDSQLPSAETLSHLIDDHQLGPNFQEPGTVLGVEGEALLVMTADGPLVLPTLQPEGKKAMGGAAWWRGITSQGVDGVQFEGAQVETA